MKLDVMQPRRLVDINPIPDAALHGIQADAAGLRLGALVTMAQAAAHPEIRSRYPVIADSLELAASAQLRNMARLGGNVLQRTRCHYFRDTSWAACNKRRPGSGCAALEGNNRQHAILGTTAACIATYPGDFAQALIALDATVEVMGPGGQRRLAFADLHRLPGEHPDIEPVLAPGDLITSFSVPAGPWTRRSLYLKIRDRASYEFALASAAVALAMEGDRVEPARIALGGVATVPWRAREAEQAMAGQKLDAALAERAAAIAYAGAHTRQHNAYKLSLGRRTLERALLQAAAMEA
jgi:xanthine dehydrogenase YagS FAD-binding subunit